MEREKEQMMREKEELMLRLQDYELKTKKAEKGGCTPRVLCPGGPFTEGQADSSTHTPRKNVRLGLTAPRIETWRETGKSHRMRKQSRTSAPAVLNASRASLAFRVFLSPRK